MTDALKYTFDEGVLRCAGTVTVDDAESLLQLLQGREGTHADLAACVHIHAASLQVLLAARVDVVAWPAHAPLAAWLRAAFAERT